jgi:peptidoglycan/LPS O-acetylase OafA/YrhL
VRLTEFRSDIQVLRGLSVIAVILFHANENLFPMGYLGVDVFFVISGYVVTPLVLRIFDQDNKRGRVTNLKYFWKRRFFRLAPSLASILTISTLLIFLFGPIDDHQRFARQGIATLILAGNVGAYKYSGDYFSPNPNPLVHTWSLSVEEQIFIFLPLILMMIPRGHIAFKKLALIVFLLISALSFIIFLFPTLLLPGYILADNQLSLEFSFYSPIERIWQFTIGGLTFFMFDRYQNISRKVPKVLSLLGMVAVVMILFGPVQAGTKIGTLVASLIAVIAILNRSLDLVPKQLHNKLEWIGNRSYSIYLFHMPLLYIAKYSPAMGSVNNESRIIQTITAIILSIVFGAINYSKIENRFRNIATSNKISYKTFVASIVLTLFFPAATLVILDRSATFEIRNSGMPIASRIPPWDWDKNCQFLFSRRIVNSMPCEYGEHDSGKSILLIGDSYAASASRAIISLGSSNGMNVYVYTFSGCGFVLSKEDFAPFHSYPYLSEACLEHNKKILKFVQNRKPIVIIYMHRSSSVMVFPNNTKSRAEYNKMIAKNLKVLMKENIKVIHIGPTPELLAITTRVQEMIKAESTFSKIPFEDSVFWQSNLVADHYLNSLDIFCQGKVCSNKSADGFLFHDALHLSDRGAMQLVPKLDEMIKEIVNSNT